MPSVKAKFAGLLPPSSKPEFSIQSSPIWVPNNRVSGVANPEADPCFGLVGGVSKYHYQTNANSYLKQKYTSLMGWTSALPIFVFKCLIKPHAINGRRLIYSAKNTLKSGGVFVDMVDGKVRVGWYDTVKKDEVYVETSIPVLDQNHWHYLYVRKLFPSAASGSGCWNDTIFSLTAGSRNDVLLVRRFRKVAASVVEQQTWDYKPSATVRNFIGFTTDLEYTVPDSAGRGLVSRNDRTYTGNAVGQITASATVFSADMIGMSFCPGTGPHQGETYRISSFTSGTVINVVHPTTGAAPDLSALVADPGGVYTGVRLVKSDGFATAENVDSAAFDIELFGSHISKDATSGVLPFDGEFSSFAYIVGDGVAEDYFEPANSATGQGNATDFADDGTDFFGNVQIYDASATEVGPLHSNEAARDAYTAVDTVGYGGGAYTTTTPNSKLEVALRAIACLGTASNQYAPQCYWQFIANPSDLRRKRSVRIAFYDPDQGIVSNPGDELVIQSGGDDGSNPSGIVSVALSKLPVTRDAGDIITRVYMTQPEGQVYFLVAEAQFGISSIVVTKNDDEIGRGEVLDFDNWPPPECDVLEITGSSLACGNLRRLVNSDGGEPVDLPDVVIYSKAFNPTAFPAANFLTVADGSREGVTALRELNGRLIVAKRDSLWRAVLRQGSPITEKVSSNIGANSGAAMVTLNESLFFWGKQGIYAYTGVGIPGLISDALREFFNGGGVEPGSALLSVGAVHPKYAQVLLTVREANALYTSHRVVVDVPGDSPRFTRHEGPNLTALCELATELADAGELVGGTEEGFFVWLDRRDSTKLMLGAAATHGDSALTVGVGSTSTRVVISAGTLDTALSGPRGAVLRLGATEAVVLGAVSGALLLDRPLASAPASGTAATLGAPVRYWETRWLDFDAPEATKHGRYLDVLFTPGSGTVTCKAFVDFGSTALVCSPHPGVAATTIDLASTASGEDVGRGYRSFDINHLHARSMKFRFESSDAFEIVDVILRVSDADAQ